MRSGTVGGASAFSLKSSMKTNRQQKRKITEVIRKEYESLAVSVKKSGHGDGQGHRKTTENIMMSRLKPQIQLQIPTRKIKLQLFPINENIRLQLEKDGYNPFLELTLSDRKKISSVVKHLNIKWGSSSVATGQLMLFSYDMKLEQLASCRRWSSDDSAITAGEVYAAVGSPSLFRLRYCWISNIQLEMFGVLPKTRPLETHIHSPGKSMHFSGLLETKNNQEKKLDEASEDIQKQINANDALHSDVNKLKALQDDNVTSDIPLQSTIHWDDLTNLSIGGLLREISWQGESKRFDFNSGNKPSWQETGLISDISVGGFLSEASLLRRIGENGPALVKESTSQPILLASSDISIGGLLSEASLLSNKSKPCAQTVERRHAQVVSLWDDSFTSLSIGGLFSEASLQAKTGCNPEFIENKSRLLPLSDSFDAFIASKLNAHSQVLKPTYHEQNTSLLDAEETCHAFPTRKLQPSSIDGRTLDATATSGACSNGANCRPFKLPTLAKSESGGSFDLALPHRNVTSTGGDHVSKSKFVK